MIFSFFTYALILANIVVFIAIRSGKLDVEDLGMSYHLVFNRKQYYRLLTAGFTHREITHILFNMLSLYNVGGYMELLFGHLGFLLIYFGSMIIGHILALLLRHNDHDDYTMSIGASGAVYGVIGAYVMLIVRFNGFSALSELIRPAVSMLVMSMLPGIDGKSHICCLAVGLVISFLLMQFTF
ncbi:MAG: rhomboid family intramembrane serine protease [Erysipelotrichaceae bacterium]|nr:rhomboid family intramembrane serine protease [Erysipelotrichaceae bacterium]